MKQTLIRITMAAGLMLAGAPAVMAEEIAAVNETRAFKSGEEAWDKVCARCHTTIDDRMDQVVGPDLSASGHDQDGIKYVVRNGQLAMPSFRQASLDDATLDELADYIVNTIQKGAAK